MRKQRQDTRHRERPKMRLLLGDTVEVISGKDRGQRGRITEIIAQDSRVRVSGLAIQTKHQRPGGRSRAMQRQAGRLQMPGTIHVSNVMLVCPSCARRVRPRYPTTETGKHRVCPECNAVIPRANVEE